MNAILDIAIGLIIIVIIGIIIGIIVYSYNHDMSVPIITPLVNHVFKLNIAHQQSIQCANEQGIESCGNALQTLAG